MQTYLSKLACAGFLTLLGTSVVPDNAFLGGAWELLCWAVLFPASFHLVNVLFDLRS